MTSSAGHTQTFPVLLKPRSVLASIVPGKCLTDIQNPGFPGAVYRNHTLPSGVVDIFSVFSKPKLENRRTDTSLAHVSAELLPIFFNE